MRATCDQAGNERVLAVTGEKRIQCLNKSAATANERCATSYIPLVFRTQCEREVCQSCGDARQFVSHRSHRLNLERRIFKCLPFAAFGFTAAGKNGGTLKCFALACSRRLPVVSQAGIKSTEKDFIGRRIENAPGDGLSLTDHRNGDTEFRDSRDEFACSVQGVYHPDPFAIES